MNMKRFFFALVVALMALPSMAQLRWGLVKEEGGFTNVRKGPGTKYEIVDQVRDGMFLQFSAGTKGWYKVYETYTDGSDPKMIGYMSANKIVVPQRAGAAKRICMVKDEDGYTNVRKGPGTKYAIVDKVLDGSYVLISGDYGDKWYKIYTQRGAFRGYISANKLEDMESPEF